MITSPPSVLQEPDSLGLKNRGGKNNCKELESQSKGAKGRRRLRRRGEAKKKNHQDGEKKDSDSANHGRTEQTCECTEDFIFISMLFD